MKELKELNYKIKMEMQEKIDNYILNFIFPFGESICQYEISKEGLKDIIKNGELYKRAFELLINEVSLERWYADGSLDKEQLRNYYLEKARNRND